MFKTVVRKEHKNQWERRAPLTPEALSQLREQGYSIDVETSDIRIFSDDKYQAAGATLVATPHEHEFVIGIKEPPVNSIQSGQVHLAFSHTIKGQAINMPLLQRFLDQGATLIDYEPIVDEKAQRTIAFGRYAGIAGAIDSFHIAGKKYQLKGIESPLTNVKATVDYSSIDAIKAEFSKIDVNSGEPVRVLVLGSGKVGQGSLEVCRWLGLPEISIDDLKSGEVPQGSWFALARSKDCHQHKAGSPFDFEEFAQYGKERYESTFYQLLGRFDILLQTPFWTDDFPKHLPAKILKNHRENLPVVIGDISCDIDGSLECTMQPSHTDAPAYTYCPESHSVKEGISWQGPTVMAIDNLPCELPLDASEHFSSALCHYVPAMMSMDLSLPFEDLELPEAIKQGVIVYRGKLTEKYQYLNAYL